MFRRGAASTTRSAPALLVLAGVVAGLGLGAAGWSMLTREPAPPVQLPTTVVTLPPRDPALSRATTPPAPTPQPASAIITTPMVVGAQPLGPPAEAVLAPPQPTSSAPATPSGPAAAPEMSPLRPPAAEQPTTRPAQPEATPTSRGTRINVNTATLAELELLPNIGPALAQRIVDYRTQHGPFRSLDDLDQVRGIGPRTLEQLRDLVAFE